MKFLPLALIWACFLVRGFFYCSFMPLWEGYDEWAHFAYIDRLAAAGGLLVDRETPLSREIGESLRLCSHSVGIAQLSWADARRVLASYEIRTRDPHPAVERNSQKLSSEPDPSGLKIYEALQPPLYYWLAARIAGTGPLLNRVYRLRYFSMAVGSFAIPLVFFAAIAVSSHPLAGVAAAALLCVMPGFLIDVSRVGNECLAVVLFSS